MAFRQDQKNFQKQKVSQSPQLIEAVKTNEKSDLEIQNIIDLEILTDAFLEEASLEFGDDETNDQCDPWDRLRPCNEHRAPGRDLGR